MDVKDFLARVGPPVQDEPVSSFVDPRLLSEAGGHPDHAAERRLVRVGHVCDGRYGLVGDDENMGRRLGLDVPKRSHQLVLIDEIGGNIPANDLREDRVRNPDTPSTGLSARYPTALIMSKIGRYMATIMPPTTTPSTTIMIGSMAASSTSTAASTSSS